jgi:hypothetical protein
VRYLSQRRAQSGQPRRVLPLCGASSGAIRTSTSRPATIHFGGTVGVTSRFASDVARETPTGRCSQRDADTNNRPRSRSARRPCPRRNAPRRRRADTNPEPTEPPATPSHALPSPGFPQLLSMDPTEMHRVSQVLLRCRLANLSQERAKSTAIAASLVAFRVLVPAERWAHGLRQLLNLRRQGSTPARPWIAAGRHQSDRPAPEAHFPTSPRSPLIINGRSTR